MIQIMTVGGLQYTVSDYVNSCPKCHRAIEKRTNGQGGVASDGSLEAVFQCPHCLRWFIAAFRVERMPNAAHPYAMFVRFEPVYVVSKKFDRVDSVSPTFAAIYNEASAAEAHGLNQIAGVGYRKSLEFLVKDFCIARNPSCGEEIKKASLGSVINDYVDDPKVKGAAKRTAWLGNDETHYERKWEGRDLQDLKNLLHLTVNGIEGILEYEEYIVEMDKPR